jgi:hypothetical protein
VYICTGLPTPQRVASPVFPSITAPIVPPISLVLAIVNPADIDRALCDYLSA